MAKMNKVKSIGDLEHKCNNGDQQEQYTKLAKCAAENLGSNYPDTTENHFKWLYMNAMETSEEGVVDEINFCLDLV